MSLPLPVKDLFFRPLVISGREQLPERFTLFNGTVPHPLCVQAAGELQLYLQQQKDWQHNFGLSADMTGAVIGKMFGVLVVRMPENGIGYLAAFSGKLAGGNQHVRFVPPVFDALTGETFLNTGMEALKVMSAEIKQQEALNAENSEAHIRSLKMARKAFSAALQEQLFDQYYFLNRAGEEKSLRTVFSAAAYKNPPVAAGECAGPKLLQYAFRHGMKPLALAEFWWGQSPKSATWQHGHFYPCCREKCGPIMAHMLHGIDDTRLD